MSTIDGTSELLRRVLSIAATQVGVREHGRNRGPEIDGYSRDIGRDPSLASPWCAIFVTAIFKRAADQMGVRCPAPLTAGCWTLDEKSPPEVRSKEPSVGAIFITRGHKHTGLVVSFDEVNLSSIEGNTSVGGSADGDGVYARTRPRDQVEVYLDFSRVALVPG